MKRRLPVTRQEVCAWISIDPDEHQFDSSEEAMEAALRLATLFMLAAEDEDPLYHIHTTSDAFDPEAPERAAYERWPFAESLVASLTGVVEAFESEKREMLRADKVARA